MISEIKKQIWTKLLTLYNNKTYNPMYSNYERKINTHLVDFKLCQHQKKGSEQARVIQ